MRLPFGDNSCCARARISSFETFYSDPESLTIVLLSKYVEWQPSSLWCSPNCCWKMLSLSDLVTSEQLLPRVAHCIPVLSSRFMGKCAARVLKRSGYIHTGMEKIQRTGPGYGPEIERYGNEPEIGPVCKFTFPLPCEQKNWSSLSPLSGSVWFLQVTSKTISLTKLVSLSRYIRKTLSLVVFFFNFYKQAFDFNP